MRGSVIVAPPGRRSALPILLTLLLGAVTAGQAHSAEPAPANPVPEVSSGELEVRTPDEQGSIFIDGQHVGEGTFRGTLPAGRHQLRVTRPGYETFEAWVELEPGQVRSETVSLRHAVESAAPTGSGARRSPRGLYAGIQLLGAFQPDGAGTTFDDACDTTGATTCSAGTSLGAGLSGYIGWLIEPLGLELGLLATAHVLEPSTTFDGEHGSRINPIVAAPAREEQFTIGRFGGGAALRGRLWYALGRVRFTVAAGPGFVYRTIAFSRETRAEGGYSSSIAEHGIDYVSPLLSLELGAQLALSESLALSLGVVSWFEHAGDDAKSRRRNDTVLFVDEETRPLVQATPAYDLAKGPQWFIGPSVGVAFGP